MWWVVSKAFKKYIFKKSKLCSSQSKDSCSAKTVLVSMSTGKEPCGIAMVSHTQPSCTQTQSAQDAAILALSLRGGMLKRAQRQTKAKCCHTNIGLRLPPYKTQDSTKWLVWPRPKTTSSSNPYVIYRHFSLQNDSCISHRILTRWEGLHAHFWAKILSLQND